MNKEIKKQLVESFVKVVAKQTRIYKHSTHFEGSFFQYVEKNRINITKVRNSEHRFKVTYYYGTLKISIETSDSQLLYTMLEIIVFNANHLGGKFNIKTWGLCGQYIKTINY